MVSHGGDHIMLVVNAACKAADLAYLRAALPDCEIEELDRALIALQGPMAEAVLAALDPAAAAMRFMDMRVLSLNGTACPTSRSGYTGEDGYEISVPRHRVEELAGTLLEDDRVQPIGLGARDSLRLEAGLCLYGHDIDRETSPIEAGLGWAIQKIRRSGGRVRAGFPARRASSGTSRREPRGAASAYAPRAGRRCARERSCSRARRPRRLAVHVTSGGFGPSVEGPVSMGYVPAALAVSGGQIFGEVRGKRLPAKIVDLPFHSTKLQTRGRDAMKYTEEHEWLRPEGDLLVVGITAHATEQLGDLVFVELPEPGDQVEARAPRS